MDAHVQLGQLTTLRMGGTPLRYYRPDSIAPLRSAFAECRRAGIPWRVLGGGSNVLAEEGALPYAVIHVHAPGFDRLRRTAPGVVRAGAGVVTAALLARCRDWGLGGLEFLAGIPGTAGGALAGNAGAWGRDIADAVRRLWMLRPDGRMDVLPRRRLRPSYRRLETGPGVIVEAEFLLEPRSADLIARQMAGYASERRARHPLGQSSAGCVFKNPPGASAGRLLQLCGLKGARVGRAEVSRQHANFIVNRGRADAADVLALIEMMRDAVRDRFGVELELEVKHWPARAEAA
jgi:UDP-N-acetylmuramate dehydrogenase